MTRRNRRPALLEAALRVADRHGISAVKIESVAAEADVTKGGFLYHFRTRHALLSAVYVYIAQCWEEELLDTLDVPAETATDLDRFKAYVRVSARPMSRAEIAFLAAADLHPEYIAPWAEVEARWLPVAVRDSPFSEGASRLVIARLAADGLRVHKELARDGASEIDRHGLAERILELLDRAP